MKNSNKLMITLFCTLVSASNLVAMTPIAEEKKAPEAPVAVWGPEHKEAKTEAKYATTEVYEQLLLPALQSNNFKHFKTTFKANAKKLTNTMVMMALIEAVNHLDPTGNTINSDALEILRFLQNKVGKFITKEVAALEILVTTEPAKTEDALSLIIRATICLYESDTLKLILGKYKAHIHNRIIIPAQSLHSILIMNSFVNNSEEALNSVFIKEDLIRFLKDRSSFTVPADCCCDCWINMVNWLENLCC